MQFRKALLYLLKGEALHGWEFAANLLMRHVRLSLQLGEKRRRFNVGEGNVVPPLFRTSTPPAPIIPVSNRASSADFAAYPREFVGAPPVSISERDRLDTAFRFAGAR